MRTDENNAIASQIIHGQVVAQRLVLLALPALLALSYAEGCRSYARSRVKQEKYFIGNRLFLQNNRCTQLFSL